MNAISTISPLATPHIAEMFRHLQYWIDNFELAHVSESKQAILKAFIKIAVAEGYSAVTIRSIARVVNIKPPTIYSHFEQGKEQIVSEALRLHAYQYSSKVIQAFEGCQTPKSYWDALVKLHTTQILVCQDNEMWDLFMNMERISHVLDDDLHEQIMQWNDFYDSTFQSISADLGFPCSLVKARAIRQLLDASARWWQWDGTEENILMACEYANKLALTILAMHE